MLGEGNAEGDVLGKGELELDVLGEDKADRNMRSLK
jgi:hypothetical protein